MPGKNDDTAYPQPGQIPRQTQVGRHDQPGLQHEMTPRPVDTELEAPDQGLVDYKAAGKLVGKVAIVTGGDSGMDMAGFLCAIPWVILHAFRRI